MEQEQLEERILSMNTLEAVKWLLPSVTLKYREEQLADIHTELSKFSLSEAGIDAMVRKYLPEYANSPSVERKEGFLRFKNSIATDYLTAERIKQAYKTATVAEAVNLIKTKPRREPPKDGEDGSSKEATK